MSVMVPPSRTFSMTGVFEPFPYLLIVVSMFSEEENFFEIAEAVFVGWFTFEYVVRFIAAPRKSQSVHYYHDAS